MEDKRLEEQLEKQEIYAGIEAILFISEAPVPVSVLANTLALSASQIEQALLELQQEYAGGGGRRMHGWCLRQVGGGWRLYSQPKYAELVKDFLSGDTQSRLSQAALETLAVIAYRQPVTRGGVAKIRGVNVDGVVRTLLAHGLIEPAGMSVSGAITYQTTTDFLEKTGLNDISELPALAPLLPAAEELEAIDSELDS